MLCEERIPEEAMGQGWQVQKELDLERGVRVVCSGNEGKNQHLNFC